MLRLPLQIMIIVDLQVTVNPLLQAILEDVKVTNDYTFVALNISVLKNCTVSFPSSIYIEGNGFRNQAMAIFDSSNREELEFNS